MPLAGYQPSRADMEESFRPKAKMSKLRETFFLLVSRDDKDTVDALMPQEPWH